MEALILPLSIREGISEYLSWILYVHESKCYKLVYGRQSIRTGPAMYRASPKPWASRDRLRIVWFRRESGWEGTLSSKTTQAKMFRFESINSQIEFSLNKMLGWHALSHCDNGPMINCPVSRQEGNDAVAIYEDLVATLWVEVIIIVR
jgi:hypothetical protein